MLACLLPLVLAAVAPAPAQAYYGRHSTEAVLTYHAEADVAWPDEALATAETLNSDTAERALAVARVGEQVRHLMGTFQSASFLREFGYPGALGEAYELRFTGARQGSGPGRRTLEYDFRGVVVFHKDAFDGHGSRLVPVKLPRSPDLIYDLGVRRSHGQDRNRCTDREFNGADDFWYYWDPDLPSCPLAADETAVVRVTGRLERIPNTRATYPEYDRLYGDNGNGDALKIAVFLGYIRALDDDPSKINRRDEAVKAFHFVDRELRGRGFAVADKRDFFRLDENGQLADGANFLRVYEKPVPFAGGVLRESVLVLLTDTDFDSQDQTFHRFAARALNEADIFLYDGHSNFGKNVDINNIPGASLDPDKYQIFVFNGCSTYPYFNGMYFRAKGGTRNLDVITAGLPEFASSSGPNIAAFLAPFLEGRTPSYQKLLSDVEDSNGPEAGTFLVGVKGDEDNEWSPGPR